MFKVIAVVASLLNPNTFAVFVGENTFATQDECSVGVLPMATILKSHYEPRIAGGVSVRSECKTEEEIAAMLKKLEDEDKGPPA